MDDSERAARPSWYLEQQRSAKDELERSAARADGLGFIGFIIERGDEVHLVVPEGYRGPNGGPSRAIRAVVNVYGGF